MRYVGTGGKRRYGLKGQDEEKINERTYAIRGYGLNGEAWVEESTKGRMRYVGTG
jgi:hypothetical protein